MRPTREQFVAAYLNLPGTTAEMAHEVYDILSGPDTVEFLQAVDDICQRVTTADTRAEAAS
jgi:hypothetical protein